MDKYLAGKIQGPVCFMLVLHLFIGSTMVAYAQQDILKRKITLEQKNAPLEDILSEIEIKHGVAFSHTDKVLSGDTKISIKASDLPLYLVLEEIFEKNSIAYTLVDNHIILFKKPKKIISPPVMPAKAITKQTTKGWEFEFTAGYAFRKLRSTSTEGNDITTWRKKEIPKIGFDAQFTRVHHYPSGLIAAAGIGILNVGEKGTHTLTKYEENTSGTFDGYHDGYYKDGFNGNRINYGSTDGTNSTRIDWTHQLSYDNNYTYLGLPLLSGYEYKKGHFVAGFKAGLAPVLMIASGKRNLRYYDYEAYYAYEDLSDWRRQRTVPPKKIDYKTFNVICSLEAALSYRGSRFTYSIGPSYRQTVTSIYKKNAPVRQKSFLLGISAGIHYTFK